METVSGICISIKQPKIPFLANTIGKYKIRSYTKRIMFVIAILVLVGIIALVYIIHTKKGKIPFRAVNN